MDSRPDDPPIVGIGASAGGVAALKELFKALPANTGAAFVVVVHLDPERRSDLAGILANQTEMPVLAVESSSPLLRDHVYVISPNRRLRVADHTIAALPFDEPRLQRAPIDLFFRSLAEQHHESFAVVLTGAGADGALGVRAIKEADGIVLVQDPSEAEYPSMPRSAIATGVADVVLPTTLLAARLAELIEGRRRRIADGSPGEADEEALRRILSHVRLRTGHDFSQYKRATLHRRIARRAQITRKESFSEYYLFLREDAEEAQSLFADFLITVTTFFRDSAAFAALEREVIPQILMKKPGEKVRVWVPGCATGEEAYTIGILLLEAGGSVDPRPEFQVFGSDLDVGALTLAREGRFAATIEADVSPDRLRRFFQREGDHYRVRRELRDIVLFASHSLLRDPPFSRLDLISCRNLLIYLDRNLQQQAISTFHYALDPDRFLFLGASESADQPGGLFRTIDRDARIYRANPTMGNTRIALPILAGPRNLPQLPPLAVREPAVISGAGDAALHRQMLERIAPPSLLVDMTHRAIHLSDTAGRFLQPGGGPVTTDAVELVRSELRFDLRVALHRAFDRNESTLTMPIPVQFNGGAAHRVFLQVKPVVSGDDPARFALVIFIEGEAIEPTSDDSPAQIDGLAHPNETIRRLQEELQVARSLLRATREESEAATEELRAANEELQSINEEYRSTSEELETSKEELQSINEELQTVNNELKLKLEGVSRAHSDLQNLMAAADFGTLFLDASLRIKRFTPRVTELFNITTTDEGRPITDFTHQLDYNGLADQARVVLRELTSIEHEVQSRDGRWYLVRIRPYRTIDDKIDGVVATFVNITQRRNAEMALRESEARLRQEMRLVDLSRAPIFVWDFDNGIVQWNRGSEELYGYSREEALGRRKEELLKTEVPGSSFAALREALLRDGSWSGEVIHHTRDGRTLTVETQIELTPGPSRLVLESTRDISERRKWEERQKLLLSELSHRVRNTLAVVQSMARQTLQSAPAGADFVKRFEGRLNALATAHKLLMATDWAGADLTKLAHGQIDAHASGDLNRLTIRGEPVTLPPDLATPFGLVLHELSTNAAKYGAFSTPQGRVDLFWTVDSLPEGRGRRLAVTWRETGGPKPAPEPHVAGLGTRLIDHGIPRAEVARRYNAEGFVCTITLVLDEGDVP